MDREEVGWIQRENWADRQTDKRKIGLIDRLERESVFVSARLCNEDVMQAVKKGKYKEQTINRFFLNKQANKIKKTEQQKNKYGKRVNIIFPNRINMAAFWMGQFLLCQPQQMIRLKKYRSLEM